MMQDVVKFLEENSVGFLATVDNGKPRVRPFQFMLEEGGKLYFCTSNAKDVFSQLKANPYVEFSCSTNTFAWIRVQGKAVFSNDPAIKAKILEKSELVKSIYQKPDNPIFEIFYLAEGNAVIADFSGQPPKKVNF